MSESPAGIQVRWLGSGFSSATYHRLLLCVRSGELEVRVDGGRVAQVSQAPSTASIGLITLGVSAAFDGVSVSP